MQSSGPIRILIGDHHEIVRRGIKAQTQVVAMQARLVLDGIPTLTCPPNSSDFDTESEVLAQWLVLADMAFAMAPSPTVRRSRV